MSQMEPAIREYLSKMRDEAFIQIKQGYTDTGATYGELHPSIGFSAYVPPAPKEEGKGGADAVPREHAHLPAEVGTAAPAPDSFGAGPGDSGKDRSASGCGAEFGASATGRNGCGGAGNRSGRSSKHDARAAGSGDAAGSTSSRGDRKEEEEEDKNAEQATEKPGKKEKIRFGQAPRETLPTATTNTATENAGALPETASAADQPANPLEPTAPTKKTRFSERAQGTEEQGKSDGWRCRMRTRRRCGRSSRPPDAVGSAGN